MLIGNAKAKVNYIFLLSPMYKITAIINIPNRNVTPGFPSSLSINKML